MKLRIISIGKIKDNDILSLINSYIKKISHFISIEIISIPESNSKNESIENINESLKREKDEILKYINDSYNISLCIEGEQLDSISLSKKVDNILINNTNKKYINFIIGGSYGLHDDIKNKSQLKLSFSKLTFNHQIFQLILLEQIYRSFTIIKNISYHK